MAEWESREQAPEYSVSKLTLRISLAQMHRRFVDSIGPELVRSHGSFDCKPLEVDLKAPLPQRVRVYLYNATRPPGGRPLGEHKVQLLIPGQRRGERGSFNHEDGRIVLLVGYAAEENVFIFWDAGLYPSFAWSRNVQVRSETIVEACAGKIATQERLLRSTGTGRVTEIVLAAGADRIAEAITRRMELTRERLLAD